MALSLTIDVLVVSPNQTVSQELNDLADRHNWPVLRTDSVRQAMIQVMHNRPRAIVVEVSSLSDKTLNLIRMVHSSWRKVAVVAVAQDHGDAVEIATRTAGVTAYLPDNNLLEQTLDCILSPAPTTRQRVPEPEPAVAVGAEQSSRWVNL